MNIITKPSFFMRRAGKKNKVTARAMTPSVNTMEKLFDPKGREKRFKKTGFVKTPRGWIKSYGGKGDGRPGYRTPKLQTPHEVMLETLPERPPTRD